MAYWRVHLISANWNFTSEARYFPDFATAPHNATALSVRATDINWERLASFPQLQEITAVDPTAAQLDLIGGLVNLKRLRIASASISDLKGLTNLPLLEELALIWVRGISDFHALRNLPKLRSLYLENINGLSDFSSLAGIKGLTTLAFNGKIGKPQRLANLDFISDLGNLQILTFGNCIYQSKHPVFKALKSLKNLTGLSVVSGCVSINDWAYLYHNFPYLARANEPLIHIERAGHGNLVAGVHSADAVEGMEDGAYTVLFGVKGFGLQHGIKAEILPKIRRFEIRWKTAIDHARKL